MDVESLASNLESLDVNDNIYTSNQTDLEHLVNFNQDLKLDASSSQEETNSSASDIKLGEKDFDENEYQSEEEEKSHQLQDRRSSVLKKIEENVNLPTSSSTTESSNENRESTSDDDYMPVERNEEWRSQSKHIFILSEAGKPIYSLHGSEDDLVTFMGLLQALVSIIECDNENSLKHVIAGEHKIVFMHRNHLILVNVSNTPDMSIEQLELELTYCYNQILSVVTLSLITKIFSKHHNYDLRNKLTGTEKLLTNIVNRVGNDYGMLLNCVNSYPLQHESREQIADRKSVV